MSSVQYGHMAEAVQIQKRQLIGPTWYYIGIDELEGSVLCSGVSFSRAACDAAFIHQAVDDKVEGHAVSDASMKILQRPGTVQCSFCCT